MIAAIGKALAQGRPRVGLVLLLGAGASLALLLLEGSGSPAAAPYNPPFAHFDKLLHAAAHAWLATLLAWGLALARAPRAVATVRRHVMLAAVLAFGVDFAAGLAVEVTQLLVGAAHGRRFDWWDAAANAVGAVVATGLFLAVALRGTRPYTVADSRPENDGRAV
ncbi:MAG: hypothetical protein KF754_12800 [Planctomycetes bacterium]|nr:hypothetical protein [Planctomycetota bacterium]